MSQYEIEKHPDYFRTEEDKTWRYILLAIIGAVMIFILWLVSRIF